MKMNKLKSVRLLGQILILVGFILIAIRSFSIEIFERDATDHKFLAPSGYIMKLGEKDFSFGVAGDTGAINAPLERVIKEIRAKEADFILYLGDLVKYRNPSHFNWMVDEVAVKLKDLPFYMVPGNHEIISEDGVVDKTLYTSIFGQPYYWFSYKDTLFIGLDSSEEKFDKIQMKWFESILNALRHKYKHCIIFTHVPPLNPKGLQNKTIDFRSRNLFASVIRDKDIDLIIAGHVHYFSRSHFGKIPMITVPVSGQESRDEIENPGYLMVNVSDDGIEVKEYYIPLQKNNDSFEMWLSGFIVKDNINRISMLLLIFGFLLFLLSEKYRRL